MRCKNTRSSGKNTRSGTTSSWQDWFYLTGKLMGNPCWKC